MIWHLISLISLITEEFQFKSIHFLNRLWYLCLLYVLLFSFMIYDYIWYIDDYWFWPIITIGLSQILGGIYRYTYHKLDQLIVILVLLLYAGAQKYIISRFLR